jgi:hypothetical protein
MIHTCAGHNNIVKTQMPRLLFLFILLLVACSPQQPTSPVATPPVATPEADGLVRTADGKPDLSGVWQAMTTANWNLEPHAASQGASEVLGAIGAVPPGVGVVEGELIPYLPAALKQRELNFASRRTEDPEAKCFRPGVPRATYLPYPFRIIQTDSEIFIAYQYAMATRSIYMTDQIEAPFDTWMGWSNGHWEGDTLVVDVTGQNGQSWFDRAGNYASAGIHVTERYTPKGPDHILYEATIEDADVFSRPWKISLPLYRNIETQVELPEFKCVEFAEELMYGHLKKNADALTNPNEGGAGND